MASKVALSYLLLTRLFSSSYVHVGLCQQNSLDQLLPASFTGNGAFLEDAQCMQRLLPCQPYVKNPVNPSEACCGPLKDISQDDILRLPQACGIEVDLAKCNNTGGATSPAAEDGEISMPEEDTVVAAKESRSTKMIIPYGIVALLTALVFYAY
ncbi:hypothetical protein Fmac_005417 [Flemingia macrophylla]|uniref:Bifunctional inhibitor/plant lipid transfer protein/seed storage helical domain-containing protein n=1 Tax=Flemingia macrophylla TaxID=520843 RepID=A0ABD1N8R1_9FABA